MWVGLTPKSPKMSSLSLEMPQDTRERAVLGNNVLTGGAGRGPVTGVASTYVGGTEPGLK